jgi:hypothetical protein
MITRPYLEQNAHWPSEGRHILACFDDTTIVVYQAYRPSIGEHALKSGALGGPDFSWSRMSWIKPNFLWMMYRSGWATKSGQEIVLGLRISRAFFDELISAAVLSSYDEDQHASREAWAQAVAGSSVRLQWDPDHDPAGTPQARRALQLGLRGETLRRFGTTELLEVIDMSALIAEQRENAVPSRYPFLQMPAEQVYRPRDPVAAANVRLHAE